MTRALVFPAATLLALASCATMSGLADKESVDCPGECIDGATSTPTSTSTRTSDSSPPDASADGGQEADAEPSFVKPDGWELVAVATTANGEAPPACPAGFDEASDIGTSPTAGANTCECAACNITQQATCGGQPMVRRGDANEATCPNAVPPFIFNNQPAGACNTDIATVDRTGDYYRVKLAAASGGACNAAAPTPRLDRVIFAERRRVCDETARCAGNVCDATVPAPFAACIASVKGSGERECPTGFPQKLVAGDVDVACTGGTCTCTTNKTCTGTFTFYEDPQCTSGAATIAADDTCRNPNLSGVYAAYRVTATPTTTCVAAGSSNATVTPKDVRTICCR